MNDSGPTEHCGLVAVIGAPNAGKSTLVNALVGQKVAIVSAKAQTTRARLMGIALATGASNKEIARSLGITERTVKAHVGAILEKLQVRDRLQLSLVVNGQVLGQPQRSSSI